MKAAISPALCGLLLCAGLLSHSPAQPQTAAAPAARTSPPASCSKAPAGWDPACLRSLYQGLPRAWPAPITDSGVPWHEMAPIPAQAPHPAENPPSAAKTELGRKLFFDPRLSGKGEVSCASCHQPARAFTDGKPLAIGEDKLQGRRRTQTLLGSPFAPRLFWDGRVASLEEQVMHPIANDREMNQPLQEMTARLAKLDDYRQPFAEAFGSPMPDTRTVSQALASFVRSLKPEETRFDAMIKGQTDALTDNELIGLHLFRTKARCMNCHNGPLLTDHGFHDLGLSFYGRRNQDLGRFEITRDKADLGKFKTPSLRNVARAGPWMHNGLFPDLRGLMRTYNAGMGNVAANADDPFVPAKSIHIQRLNLTPDEIEALAAFLSVL